MHRPAHHQLSILAVTALTLALLLGPGGVAFALPALQESGPARCHWIGTATRPAERLSATQFMLTLAVATFLLYSPRLPSGWPVPAGVAILLAAIGLTELGTLAGEVTAGLRNRTALASLIVAPGT